MRSGSKCPEGEGQGEENREVGKAGPAAAVLSTIGGGDRQGGPATHPAHADILPTGTPSKKLTVAAGPDTRWVG